MYVCREVSTGVGGRGGNGLDLSTSLLYAVSRYNADGNPCWLQHRCACM